MAPLIIVLAVLFAAVVCLSAAGIGAWFAWRRLSAAERPSTGNPRGRGLNAGGAAAAAATPRRPRAPTDDETIALGEPQLYDRVVRVMTLIFLAAVGSVVFLTRAYPENEPAIQLLIAAGMVSIVLLQDLLPASVAPRARRWLEAAVATIFVALLTGLTGGLGSPFFLGFLLVVAGASLSLDEVAPLLLALFAASAFAVIGVIVTPADAFANGLAMLAFDVISLALLAYLASVVAREQRRAREAALSLSRFDALTGVHNRGYYLQALDQEIRRAARSGGQFAIVMLDLDNLKTVNDTLGHAQGDELLRAVTGAIQRNVRSTDVAARLGGDEFVLLLSDTDDAGARVVAEKLREDIAALEVGPQDRPSRTSASIGVVTYPADGTTIETLMTDVDKAMYEAKRRGKDQIVGYLTRTERIPTPMDGDRGSVQGVTYLERARQVGERDRQPVERSRQPAERERANSEPERPAREPSRWTDAPRADRPASAANGPRPAWDSTTPTFGDKPRGSGSGQAYVAFPVDQETPPARSESSNPRRDFSGR